MPTSFQPVFPGMLLDAAARYAQDQAAHGGTNAHDALRDMGWACTLVPEAAGGAGGTLADLAAIAEGLATHGVQLPVIETCAIVPLLLQATPAEPSAYWLGSLCDGSVSIAPLLALSTVPTEIPLQAHAVGDGYEIDGEVPGVDVSAGATHWLLTATRSDTREPAIFVVDGSLLAAPTARYRSIDDRDTADFRLSRLAVPRAACITSGAPAAEALARAENAALLLAATDTVATLAALVQHTARHLQERRQFNVALASFQVLRHRLADIHVRYLCAKGQLLHAFECHDRGAADLRRTAGLLKLSLAETARNTAEATIQMHGGMGMSVEVPATRLAQRLLASGFRYGDRAWHTASLLRATSHA